MEAGSLVLGLGPTTTARCFHLHAGAAATQSKTPFSFTNGGGSWPAKQEAAYTVRPRLRGGVHHWNPPVSRPQTTTPVQAQAQAQAQAQPQAQVQVEAEAVPSADRIDKNGRFCSPRAARELALLVLYASCLEGTDPVRLFEKRLNAPRELYDEFDKSSLLSYNHMSFGGPPVTATTMEEANQVQNQLELESATEAQVLSAPPKLVYNKLLLRFTKKLLSLVVDRWDAHVLIIDQVIPSNWKVDPAARILEFSILHLAMSEISGVGTRHQIVINEAVDLAKRFCDGSAPRIINGCLRTYVQNIS